MKMPMTLIVALLVLISLSDAPRDRDDSVCCRIAQESQGKLCYNHFCHLLLRKMAVTVIVALLVLTSLCDATSNAIAAATGSFTNKSLLMKTRLNYVIKMFMKLTPGHSIPSKSAISGFFKRRRPFVQVYLNYCFRFLPDELILFSG